MQCDIIVDNPQATFTGTWPTATSLTGFYGANYRTNNRGSGNDRAVWSLNVPTTGTYQVYTRWVAANSHASNAPFTVRYSGGSRAIAVNQRTNGGQWVLLGSFAFTAGTAGSVTLTDNANGTVIADAVRLVAATGGTTSEAIRYLHTDHLNTPRVATNAQGQVLWRWEGSAFGDTPPTSTVTINLRFPGQYYDSESGLHYNWNRYYDPKVGRYISSDPIGLAGGLNTYAYVYNNPLLYTDPTGELAPQAAAVLAGAVVGGLAQGLTTAALGLKAGCFSLGDTVNSFLGGALTGAVTVLGAMTGGVVTGAGLSIAIRGGSAAGTAGGVIGGLGLGLGTNAMDVGGALSGSGGPCGCR